MFTRRERRLSSIGRAEERETHALRGHALRQHTRSHTSLRAAHGHHGHLARTENEVKTVQKPPRQCHFRIVVEDPPDSPTLRTSTPKSQSMLIIPREESTFRESVEDMIATYDKLVIILLDRFANITTRANNNKHLFEPEPSNFRWEVLQMLCQMMSAGVYKLQKIRNCVCPSNTDIYKKPSKPYEVFALDDALSCIQLQLRSIQQCGVEIYKALNPMWEESRLIQALKDEQQTVLDLPIHFGHCLEKTHCLLHSLSPAVLKTLNLSNSKEEKMQQQKASKDDRETKKQPMRLATNLLT